MNALESAKIALQNAELKSNTTIYPGTASPFIIPSDPKTAFGSTIRHLQLEIKTRRKALGWSQRRLAINCHRSQGTITRAENNSWVSLSTLIHIADALGGHLTIVDN